MVVVVVVVVVVGPYDVTDDVSLNI